MLLPSAIQQVEKPWLTAAVAGAGLWYSLVALKALKKPKVYTKADKCPIWRCPKAIMLYSTACAFGMGAWMIKKFGFSKLACVWAAVQVSVFLFNALLCGIWWYKEPFPGLNIHVREPKVTFPKMDYTINPNDLGWDVFSAASMWATISKVLMVEVGIHQIMGDDEHRTLAFGEETKICEGMMAQEINHGKCITLQLHAQEKYLGWPREYHKEDKELLLGEGMGNLAKAFLLFLEASFTSTVELCTHWPFSWLFALDPGSNQQWCWTWHFMEEAEHCWDSVPDLLVITPFYARLGIAAVMLVMQPVVYFNALIEGCMYGWRTLVNPLKLFSSLFLFSTVGQLQGMMAWHSVFSLTVLGMRPSNKAYENAAKRWAEVHFSRVSDQFHVTHIQEPHHHLRKSNAMEHATVAAKVASKHGATFKFKAAVRALQAFGGAPMHGSEKAIKQLREARHALYRRTTSEFLEAGIDQEDLDNGAWGFLAAANGADANGADANGADANGADE